MNSADQRHSAVEQWKRCIQYSLQYINIYYLHYILLPFRVGLFYSLACIYSLTLELFFVDLFIYSIFSDCCSRNGIRCKATISLLVRMARCCSIINVEPPCVVRSWFHRFATKLFRDSMTASWWLVTDVSNQLMKTSLVWFTGFCCPPSAQSRRTFKWSIGKIVQRRIFGYRNERNGRCQALAWILETSRVVSFW